MFIRFEKLLYILGWETIDFYRI